MEVSDPNAGYAVMYGRADKFVIRAKNTFFRSLNFRSYGFDRGLDAMVGYLLRIQKLGRQVITREQREAAMSTVYGYLLRLQAVERKTGTDAGPDTAVAGTPSQVYAVAAIEASGLTNRAAAQDSTKSDPAFRYLMDHHPDDEYLDFRDPVIILANYKIRASERLKTILPPRRARQFVLTTDL